MADLYSQIGADAHVDPEYGRFAPDPQTGAFHFPDEVSDRLESFAVKGRKLWETEETRAERLHGVELARRRDPASMLTVMEENAALVRQLTELTAALASAQLGRAAAPAPDPGGEVRAIAEAAVDAPAEAPAKAARAPKAPAKAA
jgi:hypothetical protein